MIIKMTLPALFQHRKCIAAQARVFQIESLLDYLEDISDETLLEEEWEEYVLTARNLMHTLGGILNERAKSYIETEITPFPTTKEAPKHDKHIEAYLDAFDEFVDEVTERYGGDVLENATSEAVISLYRGFLAALPDIEKAGGKKELHDLITDG